MSTGKKAPPPKKRSFLEYFSILLEMAIVLGAATWLIYTYIPQYYLILSFLILAIAGILAYVILSKAAKF